MIIHKLLALLDRIEVDNNPDLATQRFDIMEEHGCEVVFEMPISGRLQ